MGYLFNSCLNEFKDKILDEFINTNGYYTKVSEQICREYSNDNYRLALHYFDNFEYLVNRIKKTIDEKIPVIGSFYHSMNADKTESSHAMVIIGYILYDNICDFVVLNTWPLGFKDRKTTIIRFSYDEMKSVLFVYKRYRILVFEPRK